MSNPTWDVYQGGKKIGNMVPSFEDGWTPFALGEKHLQSQSSLITFKLAKAAPQKPREKAAMDILGDQTVGVTAGGVFRPPQPDWPSAMQLAVENDKLRAELAAAETAPPAVTEAVPDYYEENEYGQRVGRWNAPKKAAPDEPSDAWLLETVEHMSIMSTFGQKVDVLRAALASQEPKTPEPIDEKLADIIRGYPYGR